MTMKVLVTGAKGQLGYEVVRELYKRGHEAAGVDVEEMDITDGAAVRTVMEAEKPDAVIHCAAWTAVDAAEDQPDACRLINADGTRHVAEACRDLGCKLMYISTDYVFDGEGTRPWEPDDAVTVPQNVYGQTKYEGEQAICACLDRYFIVRTAWVFGRGKNFIKTMLKLGETHPVLTVVDDQFGTPTYTFDLARLLVDMIETEKYGYYHATNEGGYISWYAFAREIFSQAGMDVFVKPVSSEEYGAKAKRPVNSRMSKQKLTENGFTLLPPWQDALSRYLTTLRE